MFFYSPEQTSQSSTLFTSTLDYFNAGKYLGNITRWNWGHSSSANQYYTLSYDKLNRLTSAVHSSGSYNETVGSYDKNGNISSLNRTPTGNKTYTYKGNKLTSLSGVSGSYTYDSYGNMTTDPRQGLKLEYNSLHLQVQMLLLKGDEKTGLSTGYFLLLKHGKTQETKQKYY